MKEKCTVDILITLKFVCIEIETGIHSKRDDVKIYNVMYDI